MRHDVRAPDLAPSRAVVHAASGNRLGASHPRQEGPTDLRLVPPALAAWATAALMLDAPTVWVGGAVVVCLVAAGVLLLRRRGGVGDSRAAGSGRDSAPGRDDPLYGPDSVPGRFTRPRRQGSALLTWPRISVAAVLLCVAAAAASAGLHGADLRRGPVPGLAREYATVTAEVEVTSDPRLTRPRVKGDHMAPTSVLINADVRRVEEAHGTAVVTRAPVLMIVDAAPRSSGAGDGNGALRAGGMHGVPRPPGSGDVNEASQSADGRRSPWLRLLPSTRLRVTARLAPALVGGDRIAAVLRVRDPAMPEVVGEPSGAQQLAGRLRAGLREATDGLPADARALLPGLVVGDTSRITPELDEAFKETDLAHTLAVSGSNLTIILALPSRRTRHEPRSR